MDGAASEAEAIDDNRRKRRRCIVDSPLFVMNLIDTINMYK
jgi:hypothetical protein